MIAHVILRSRLRNGFSWACTDTCDNTSFYRCAVALRQVHCEQKPSLARAKELSTRKRTQEKVQP